MCNPGVPGEVKRPTRLGGRVTADVTSASTESSPNKPCSVRQTHTHTHTCIHTRWSHTCTINSRCNIRQYRVFPEQALQCDTHTHTHTQHTHTHTHTNILQHAQKPAYTHAERIELAREGARRTSSVPSRVFLSALQSIQTGDSPVSVPLYRARRASSQTAQSLTTGAPL